MDNVEVLLDEATLLQKRRISDIMRLFLGKICEIWKGDKIVEKKLEIVIDNCPQNHKCPAVKVCPVGALSQKDFEAPQIDYGKCISCGKCSNFCPKKALVL